MATKRTWKSLDFALYSSSKYNKVPVLILRQEGDTIFYRPIRSDGKVGPENTIIANSPRLAPLKGPQLSLRIEGVEAQEAMAASREWEVTLPDFASAMWRTYRFPLSKTEAIRVARSTFGADTLGRIYIARPVIDTEPRLRSNL